MAAKKHREYGIHKAIYEAKVYPGITKTLGELRAKGVGLAVATLKKQEIAETILRNFGLVDYFRAVVGMDASESLTKSMTIREAMKLMHSSEAVMIGDTEYDYAGAVEAGVDFIGVLYGFGFRAGTDYHFRTVSALAVFFVR